MSYLLHHTTIPIHNTNVVYHDDNTSICFELYDTLVLSVLPFFYHQNTDVTLFRELRTRLFYLPTTTGHGHMQGE